MNRRWRGPVLIMTMFNGQRNRRRARSASKTCLYDDMLNYWLRLITNVVLVQIIVWILHGLVYRAGLKQRGLEQASYH